MLKLPDENRHVEDINRFHLEPVHTPKVCIQVCTLPHPHLPQYFPLALIRLTLFHKLTCDHLQERPL